MKSKSLNQTINMIIENLDKMDINDQDKVELMINLREFLKPKNYKENVNVLEKERLSK
jgi:hypothetical protein